MRALLQRVKEASVNNTSKIKKGILIFIGINREDREEDAKLLSKKIPRLRIFEDENSKMNLSLMDVGGEILVVSEFTLYANCSHGRRPSFSETADYEKAFTLYKTFINSLKEEYMHTKEGIFGEHMEVSLINDGPVTILLETKYDKDKNSCLINNTCLIIDEVYSVISQRKKYLPKDSYSATLFKEGKQKILSKLKEELGELLEEAEKESVNEDRINEDRLVEELVDLWFHTLVLLNFYDIPLLKVYKEFSRRRK